MKTLSEKRVSYLTIEHHNADHNADRNLLKVEDVKEKIKDMRKELKKWEQGDFVDEIIDKHMGKDLK